MSFAKNIEKPIDCMKSVLIRSLVYKKNFSLILVVFKLGYVLCQER